MPTSAPPRGPTLRIVCINDVYTLENLPRFKSLVGHYRETNPADMFLVTLAGDFVAPSILSSLDAGKGMIECMNDVGITHVIFGNHEDDISTDALRQRVQEFNGIWLNTNVPGFEPRLPASQVLEIAHGGRTVRIGLLGVVMDDATVYHRPPFGGTGVEPPLASAQREAARLYAVERCTTVIPLTHQPMEADRDLARAQRQPPFPVIIGGHEHVVFREQVEGTWIIKSASDAVHAFVLDFEWPLDAPKFGNVQAPAVAVTLDDVANYPEDTSLRVLVNSLLDRVSVLEHATLLTLAAGSSISSVGTRSKQTTMGTLVCSRLRDALDAEACLFNGGAIRASRTYEHHLTYGDIKAEIPFDNELVVAHLPGSVIRDSVFYSRAKGESGGYLQVDDRMATDDGNAVTTIAGAPLELSRDYRVAIVRNLFAGLDHIEPLIEYGKAHPDRVPPVGCGREVKLVLVDAFALAIWKSLGEFDTIDRNHDGVVTKDELAEAISRVTLEKPSDITADLVLHAVDADHTGAIERIEGLTAGLPKKPA